MADAEETPESMEVTVVDEVGGEDEKPEEGGDASKASTNGTDEAQEKTEKSQSKAANKVESIKKDSSGFSNVSPSYSQLQSGLQDIVKNYVASKSSTTPKPPSSNSTAKPEEKKTSEGNEGKRKKEDDTADTFGGSSKDDRNYFDEFLDRTKADYYCKICDSHMNSEQMWENHVQGKRHLKNIKKDPGEPPSKVKAVRTDLTPKINKILDTIREPVVGLDYMCELQRAESYLDPTYSCFLCHATCTVSSVVDHILGTKHRLAYLKEVNPSEYSLVEEMKLKKSGLTSISEDYAREYERKRGRGRMEVKIEKPKMAPPPSKKERRFFEDDDDDDLYYRRRPLSPPMGSDWRRERDRWSPPLSSLPSRIMQSAYMSPPQPPNYAAMSMKEKMHVLRQVCNNLIVVCESEGMEIMEVINSLTQSLLQYKIRVLPPQLQDTLARHIISGDTQALENTLGLGSSGMSNVGSVINSMAASGNLPMRTRRPLSPPIPAPMPPNRMGGGHPGPGGMGPGGMNAPDGSRGTWGPPGPGGHMQGGYRGTTYPNTSQWQGGMGGSSFRGSDRSSLGY